MQELEFLVEPNKDIFLKKGLSCPHFLVRIDKSGSCYIAVANFSNTSNTMPKGCTVRTVTPVDVIEATESPAQRDQREVEQQIQKVEVGSQLARSDKEQLFRLLRKYAAVFPTTSRPLGCLKGVEHCIDTGDARPIAHVPYRRSFAERVVIRQEVSKLLEQGIARPSCSPWAAPVVLVKKKCGATRFCSDFLFEKCRKANECKFFYQLMRDALNLNIAE